MLPFLLLFLHFMSLCSTWMVSNHSCDFFLSSLKLCCNAFSFFISTSLSSPISIALPFSSSKIWRKLSIYSIVSVVPLSLEAFSASSCSSLSIYILKRVEIFMVASFREKNLCVLANQSLGPSPLSEPVLNHYLPSVHSSTLI